MKRVAASIIAITLLICLFSGCQKNPNNAVILDGNASGSIDSLFYDANYTRGAYYDGGAFLADESYPASRSFVIRTNEEYENVFSREAVFDVDFSREMLVIYTFTAHYVRPVVISDFSVESDCLRIELSMQKKRGLFSQSGDACMPFQRYVIIRTGVSEVSSVEVSVKGTD